MKKGIHTSEFWVALIVSVATLLNQSGLLGDVVLPIESITVIAGLIASYVLSRGLAKLNTPKEE